ncbi:unnamed protein product [Lactuca saligna]|uniref:Peptidase A1 domain-containing protein n=1 Tax=Lactuca saligna TaxID=75948 RepID=A0AA35V506_LACSI|nr:unnamed protein product [Lactuca saligna]
MNLRPQDYLLQQKMDADEVWCLGIKRNNYKDQRLNILGDIVLKDKIFVYDLGGQRIGWAERNCSSIVYVSTSSGSSSPLQITSYEVVPALVLAFIVHLTVVRCPTRKRKQGPRGKEGNQFDSWRSPIAHQFSMCKKGPSLNSNSQIRSLEINKENCPILLSSSLKLLERIAISNRLLSIGAFISFSCLPKLNPAPPPLTTPPPPSMINYKSSSTLQPPLPPHSTSLSTS